MRSIGKVNIKKLDIIIKEEFDKAPKYERNLNRIKDNIEARIPGAWYDIWESAWSEIDRLISDKLTKLYYGKD